jgi:hypothetical protein
MDRVTLSVPAEEEFFSLLRLVVGGIGSRSQLSYEQTNELQLAVESLVSHRETRGGAVRLEAGVDGPTVTMALGPFSPGEDAGARRALDRLVDEVRVSQSDGEEWVELTVSNSAHAGGP